MSKKIKIEDLSEAIGKELELYDTAVRDGVRKETRKSMKKLVEMTKQTAPVGKRKNHYKDDITSRVIEDSYRQTVMQWYVKAPNHRLSHLLNNGHALKNGGRVEGTNFITQAHDAVLGEYEENVKKVIENG